VAEVARRVRDRALLWLRRHGYLDERAAEERGNEPVAPSALLDVPERVSSPYPRVRGARRAERRRILGAVQTRQGRSRSSEAVGVRPCGPSLAAIVAIGVDALLLTR